MDYTVLMSVYEKENPVYLRESIESIWNQTVLPKQFVLVKDGPLNESLERVIDEYEQKARKEQLIKFTVVSLSENQGLGPALNAGLKVAECDYIARMDSDDIAFHDRCERQLKVLKEQNVDIVSGTLLEFGENIEDIQAVKTLPETDAEILKYARRRNPFNHPCVMFKKQTIEKAGMYQPVPLFEDYDLWARALLNGAKGYNIKEPVLYMRAGSNMYLRRGGFSYVKKGVTFRLKLRKMGLSGNLDFLVSAAGQIIFGLVPNGVRKGFYKHILRR